MSKILKKLLSPVLPLCLLVCLSACGGTQTAEPSSTPAPSESPEYKAPELEGKTVSKDGVLGEYVVNFVGAEKVTDKNGSPAILVYYDFTNNSSKDVSAFSVIELSAFQNGSTLHTAVSDEGFPYEGNSGLMLRPGAALRCCALYEYSPEAGPVSALACNWTKDKSTVSYALFPEDKLFGEESEFFLTPRQNDDYSDKFASEAAMGDYYVSIGEAEFFTDSGSPCVRIYIKYTNRSSGSAAFSGSIMAYAYQDDVQLGNFSSSSPSSTDENIWADLQPGESIDLSLTYALRTESPLELELQASAGSGIAGKQFSCQ